MNVVACSLPKIYLRPEELVIAEAPSVTTTVLGSCISVVLYSPRLKLGAICHATMPSGKDENPSKYVDQSIRFMLDRFDKLGVSRRETVVKLFGGADMFSPTKSGTSRRTIGEQNVRVAMAALTHAGLEPVATDVGGTQGRKLVFYSQTGEVFRKWVKQVAA